MTMNRNTLIAIVALVGLVAVGLILFFVLHKSHHHKKTAFIRKGYNHASYLGLEAKFLHTNFFWAGAKPGTEYEFTRLPNGRMFVRYLTSVSQIGSKKAFLTIATYPITGAYSSLKASAQSKGQGIKGRNGTFLWKDPKHPTSVYMVFKDHPDYEVEVFDKEQFSALATARSGKVRLVRPAG